MKNIKLISLFLCLSLLVLSLAGCGDGDPDVVEPEENGELTTNDPLPGNHEHDEFCDHFIDFDAAINYFPPDTIMLKADELTITWAELYVFLFGMVSNLVHVYGPDLDWSEEFDIGTTLSDAVLEYAMEEALSFMTLSYGINSIGLTISDEDLKEFNEELGNLVEEYGGREAFEQILRDSGGFYSLDTFEQLFKIEFTIGFLINELYGEDASSYPDEKVSEYASQNGYMMAMHILRQKTEDDETALNEINDILDLLDAHRDSADLIDVFTELMFEFSEDPGGLVSYPNGYLFQHKDMVEAFSDACAALEIGQMSGIVESEYGYHIILRIPIDYDSTPISFSYEGIYRTLRQHVAFIDFDILQQEWRNALNLVLTPEFISIDLAVIFKVL